MSKNVKRFLLVGRVVRLGYVRDGTLVGRVVMKKLTRAMQLRFEPVKESRQRSTFTAAAISGTIVGSNFDVFYQMLNEIL